MTYTGRLDRDADSPKDAPTYSGRITGADDYPIHMFAVVETLDGRRGFKLAGTLGEGTVPMRYSGRLERDLAGATYTGHIVSRFGWEIILTATVETLDGRSGFVLTGTLGEIPAALRIAGMDDE